MRGNKAKQLRKVAQESTIGQADVQYVPKRIQKAIQIIGQDGNVVPYVVEKTTMTLYPMCTRHFYQKLKKGVKNHART